MIGIKEGMFKNLSKGPGAILSARLQEPREQIYRLPSFLHADGLHRLGSDKFV